MRESRVGKRENGAAMGDGKAVQVTLGKRHLDLREIWPGIENPHAKKLRESAFSNHRLGDGLGGICRSVPDDSPGGVF
jgi:hypothetical protein